MIRGSDVIMLTREEAELVANALTRGVSRLTRADLKRLQKAGVLELAEELRAFARADGLIDALRELDR